MGAKIEVPRDGSFAIWNGSKRNIRLNHDGYTCCSVKTINGWRNPTMHRLVAMAFIPNPHNLPEVNHKDYNRANANCDNLEWMTHEENVRYSSCNRPDYHGEKNPNYHNDTLHKKYLEDPVYAKEKQSRPGLKNGRATKIEVYFDDEYFKTFDYIKLCCQWFINNGISMSDSVESVRGRINTCIRKNTKYKKHYSFKRI